MNSNDDLMQELKKRREKLIQRNLRQARWTRYWAEILIFFLLLYVGLPFVAPTLMKVGATGPADALYTVYSPLCHQFAFRSMFIYGDHFFYPRQNVGEGNPSQSFDQRAAESQTFVAIYTEKRKAEIARDQGQDAAAAYQFSGAEELATWDSPLTLAARRFRGDPKMGYKVALCERDIAIYSAMVIGGIGFLFVRRRLRPVPLWLYVMLGIAPIGLDGFSQLLSYPPFSFWATRETSPEFRILTGALFGLMNIWLAFPYIEQSMRDSANQIEATIAAIMAEEQGSL